MSALTANRDTLQRDGVFESHGVAASTRIYAGSLVCRNASGYVIPAADTATYKVQGIAQEEANNSSGSAAAIQCKTKWGVARLATSGMGAGDEGKPVYVTDDQTVCLAASSTNKVGAGIILDVISATEVDVLVTPEAIQLAESVGAGDYGYVHIPLAAWKTEAGLTLTAGTNPVIGQNSNAELRVTWAAADVAAIHGQIMVPGDFDDPADDIDLKAIVLQTGGTDTVTLDGEIYVVKGGAAVGADLNPTAAAITKSGTNPQAITFDLTGEGVAAADILDIVLFPTAHGTDAVYFYGAYLKYKKRNY